MNFIFYFLLQIILEVNVFSDSLSEYVQENTFPVVQRKKKEKKKNNNRLSHMYQYMPKCKLKGDGQIKSCNSKIEINLYELYSSSLPCTSETTQNSVYVYACIQKITF